MTTYLVAVSGNPSTRFDQILKSLGPCLSPLPSLWLLNTSLDTSQVLNRLRTSLHDADKVLVIEVTHRVANNLSEGDKDWMAKHLR